MNDLIERQAAINETLSFLVEYCGAAFDEDMQEKLSQRLRLIPSAQPELCEDAVSRNAIIRTLNTMDRYVSEELTLCDTDEKYPKNEVFIVDDVYEEIVENLPSAQPEIIRCKDCRYNRNCEIQYSAQTGDMFFCGAAERREE